ncbi:MAG: 1,2-phenylacetyl-CoA epoxidase subunit PaaD [Saprospiraceae bacterium]
MIDPTKNSKPEIDQLNEQGSSILNLQEIESLISQITDPEIPVLTIADLGILRSVKKINDRIEITITPTYVGCPAMGMIEMNIKALLDESKIKNYIIHTVLHPAWSTSWMSEEGRKKLKEFGIAPPSQKIRIQKLFEGQGIVECPRCNSTNTEMISEFASTACKSLYRCKDCLEAFDYFKCH